MLGSLEQYYEDPVERWRALREIVREALDVAESGVFLHGAHLTSMGIVVRNRVHELVRRRMAEALKQVRGGETKPAEGVARLEGSA